MWLLEAALNISQSALLILLTWRVFALTAGLKAWQLGSQEPVALRNTSRCTQTPLNPPRSQ